MKYFFSRIKIAITKISLASLYELLKFTTSLGQTLEYEWLRSLKLQQFLNNIIGQQ